MCENRDRLQEIKRILNRRIKLINISFVGIKSDNKKISVEPILQSLSREISIPSSEGFAFFDFNNARERINSSDEIADEYRSIEIQRINDFENEFARFRNVLMRMQNAKNTIWTQFIQGRYKELKIVYARDIIRITSLNNEINEAKRAINMERFGEGMTAFIESFRFKIRGELHRHHIEENEELTRVLEQCFDGVRDINTYINRINISCNYVVDISNEVLNDISFINDLDNMSLDDEDKELIREYYRLSR